MDAKTCKAVLDPLMLMEIISVQTEIVKLGLDLGAVMALVAEEVGRITGASGAIVELAEGDEMVYRAVSGMAKPQLGLRLSRASSLSGMCVAKAEVLRCEDSETDPRVDREACRRVGLRSMIVSPLLHMENAVGALKIVSPEPHFFSETHVCILRMMSDLIAASMFHCARHEVDELYFRATHDVLTGLANRALFYDRLRQSLALAGRSSRVVCVLNLDMDGLKFINDHFGHKAGDAAILELAKRARHAARDSDTVARLGGDEFGVILTEVRDRGSAESTVERIAREIRAPFEFEGEPLALDASIGLALFPEDALEMEKLLELADQAMYRVKRTRKSRSGRE